MCLYIPRPDAVGLRSFDRELVDVLGSFTPKIVRMDGA
jgi:hypothetical protein